LQYSIGPGAILWRRGRASTAEITRRRRIFRVFFDEAASGRAGRARCARSARDEAMHANDAVRLYRWDELALEKVTEMISRKIISGTREMIAQVYLKRGALVPTHAHESEQLTCVLQGALRFLVNGEEIIVREGEVLCIPSWVEHQAEALEDTFELDVFSPIRQDWLDKTDDYFSS
jgi:quercetin dioxygenase-like cupin family protein